MASAVALDVPHVVYQLAPNKRLKLTAPVIRGRIPFVIIPVRRRSLGAPRRSEEHTSELQSQSNLVCRLLLEKKKNNTIYILRESTSHQRHAPADRCPRYC